ncbi:hypothetical protein D1871_19580 [Nakamurella silvestris]|nr:hypothetical protein D1871_19580 [Nakamurella silvestris]
MVDTLGWMVAEGKGFPVHVWWTLAMLWIWILIAWVVGALCGALVLGRMVRQRDKQRPRPSSQEHLPGRGTNTGTDN